jgi:hypothetical protein
MGIWGFTEQQVNIRLKYLEPQESYYQKQANVIALQAEVSAIQTELTAIQSKLTEQKLELLRQSFKVEAMTAAQQKPLKTPGPPPKKPTLSEAVAALDAAKIELETTRNYAGALTTEAAQKLNAFSDRSFALEEAKRKASNEYERAQQSFLWSKRLRTLLCAGIAIIGLLLIVLIIISVINRFRSLKVNLSIVIGWAALILAVLIGYQTFSLIGAAVIGTFMAVAMLLFIPGTPKL